MLAEKSIVVRVDKKYPPRFRAADTICGIVRRAALSRPHTIGYKVGNPTGKFGFDGWKR